MKRPKTVIAAIGVLILGALIYSQSRHKPVTITQGPTPQQLSAAVKLQSLHLSDVIDGLAFTPSGEELIVLTKSQEHGNNLRHVLRYRFSDSSSVELLAANQVLHGLVLSPDGKFAYSGQWRTGPENVCEVLQIDANKGGTRQNLIGASLDGFDLRITSDPTAIGISPDGNSVALGTKLVDNEYVAGGHIGGEVCVWDTGSGKVIWRNRTVHTDIVRSVAFSPDGKLLVSAGEDSLIRIWDAHDGKLLRTFVGVLWGGIRSMQISPDGHYLATGGNGNEEGGRVRVWDLSENRLVHRFKPFRQGRYVHVAFAMDGTLFAVGEAASSTDQKPGFDLHSWQANSFAPLGSIATGDGYVRSLASASSEKRVVLGTSSGDILQYDIEMDGRSK